MNILIYHTKGCQKCRLTNMLLGTTNTKMIEITSEDKRLEQFRQRGYSSFPVVEVYKDGELIDGWTDLNLDKIKLYKNK